MAGRAHKSVSSCKSVVSRTSRSVVSQTRSKNSLASRAVVERQGEVSIVEDWEALVSNKLIRALNEV